MDLNTNTVSWCGKTTKLSGLKADLLSVLVRASPCTVSHERIIQSLWGVSEPGDPDKCVKVHICQLRKAVRPLGLVIRSVHGEGYRLELDR